MPDEKSSYGVSLEGGKIEDVKPSTFEALQKAISAVLKETRATHIHIQRPSKKDSKTRTMYVDVVEGP